MSYCAFGALLYEIYTDNKRQLFPQPCSVYSVGETLRISSIFVKFEFLLPYFVQQFCLLYDSCVMTCTYCCFCF